MFWNAFKHFFSHFYQNASNVNMYGSPLGLPLSLFRFRFSKSFIISGKSTMKKTCQCQKKFKKTFKTFPFLEFTFCWKFQKKIHHFAPPTYLSINFFFKLKKNCRLKNIFWCYYVWVGSKVYIFICLS